VDSIELALRKSASEQLVGDSVDVLELVHKDLVDLEVSEAGLIQVGQSLLEDGVILSCDLLKVKLLGRLGVDAKCAVHEGADGLAFAGSSHRLINSGVAAIGLTHLFVHGGKSDILSHHVDRLGNSCGRSKDLRDSLGLHNVLWSHDVGVDAHDVAVDFVAKLDAASLKTEESVVATRLLRSLERNRKLESGSSRDLLSKGHDLGLHIIA